MLTVACDIGPLHGPATGIARATDGLIAELRTRDVTVVPWVLSARARLQPGTRRLPLPAAAALRSWAAFGWPPADRRLGNVDLVHGTNYVVPPSRHPRLVSVYDCWALDHPEAVQPDVRLAMRVLSRTIREGVRVHVSSIATADRLRSHFPSARIETIPLGPPPRRVPPASPSSAVEIGRAHV